MIEEKQNKKELNIWKNEDLLFPFTIEGIVEKRNSIYNMVYSKTQFMGIEPEEIYQSPIPSEFNNHKSRPFHIID